MAMPAIEVRRWTADEVRALPEEPGKRFECVDGELLVSPGPRLPHQSVQTLLLSMLDAYGEHQGIGAVFAAPGELELDRYTLVQPDLFVLPRVNGKRPRTQEEAGTPLLFIEILSPSTARYDRVVKRRRYQRYGVEYWIADIDSRLVERWTPEAERPEIVTGAHSWHPVGASTPLVIDFEDVFAKATGER